MEVLINRPPRAAPHVALLFGLGMIGSAIRSALRRAQFQTRSRIPVEWDDAGQREQVGDTIRSGLPELEPSRISVVWSAGRANFFSSEQEIEYEERPFEEVVELTRALSQLSAKSDVDFHYLSSAGGLFEGQKLVNPASAPSPRRPYGRMKYGQEQQLGSSLAAHEVDVYRPSSVYGPMVQPRRHGLINQLIASASNRRTAVLDANVMALRDYVYAGDIGHYIARQIAFSGRKEPGVQIHFLVSGRSASIFEVVANIERATHLKVRHRFDEFFGNSANITFSDSVLPRGWRPSTLDMGIRQFLLKDQPQTRAISDQTANFH